MRKILFSLSLFSLFQIANAEILEVYTWKPYTGKTDQLLLDMQEAASIHSGLGIGVSINALGVGTAQDIDYVLRYDDLESWGRLNDAAVNSSEWNAFIAKARANPSAELVSSFSLFNQDPSNMADNFTDPGQVINAFRWKPAAGLEGTNALRQGFLTAKAIHENLGVRVETYEINSSVDVGQMQYLMIYDSYSHMAEVNAAMATDPEWLAFQASVAAAPEQAATMVWAIVASTIANWD
ncbi:MAG: hypothetical protein CMQ15_18440 [Gammaproteobacteria bacterium]|nr:hypothetical protein [Gammaproteobacteria bacterium]